MADFLYSVDRALFYFLNRTVANAVFDLIMPVITDIEIMRYPLLAAWVLLFVFGGKKGRIAALLALIVLGLSDYVSSSIIKPWVNRVRPCFELENVRLLISQVGSPSFPSSHAANNGSVATFFWVKYGKKSWPLIVFAALVTYSRVYVGVHYPSDILGGVVLGMACAGLILLCEKGMGWLWLNRVKGWLRWRGVTDGSRDT